MPVQLAIPEDAFPGLASIAEHSKRLSLLIELVEGIEPAKRTPGFVAKIFSEKSGLPLRDARQIFTQLVVLHSLRSRYEISASGLYDSITESLASDPRAEGVVDLKLWKDARKNIEAALDPASPLYTVQKNVQLAYEHQHVVYEVKILTDIRPVFDDSGSDIKQMTISHMLELEYFDGSRRRMLYAALDAADVAKLKRACDRAETKVATLRKRLKQLPWPVEVFGEYDDE